MQAILQEGASVLDKDTGELRKETPGAAYLNVIRQFLKDNGIEAAKDAEAKSNFSDFAAKALPFLAQQCGDAEFPN